MVQVMPDSACRPDTAWKIKGKQICALGKEDVFRAPSFIKGQWPEMSFRPRATAQIVT
jgi:hypothetical protein